MQCRGRAVALGPPATALLAGAGGPPEGFSYLSQHLASWGFVVAGPETTPDGDGSGLIDRIGAAGTDSVHQFPVATDLTTVAVIASSSASSFAIRSAATDR